MYRTWQVLTLKKRAEVDYVNVAEIRTRTNEPARRRKTKTVRNRRRFLGENEFAVHRTRVFSAERREYLAGERTRIVIRYWRRRLIARNFLSKYLPFNQTEYLDISDIPCRRGIFQIKSVKGRRLAGRAGRNAGRINILLRRSA